MLSLLFTICMIWVFGKLLFFGIKAAWGKVCGYDCIAAFDIDRSGRRRIDLHSISDIDRNRNCCAALTKSIRV